MWERGPRAGRRANMAHPARFGEFRSPGAHTGRRTALPRSARCGPALPSRFGRLSAERPFCFQRAANGRPYEKVQSVRLASRRTVGATIGRPFCPVRFGRFPKDGNIYFRRAADGRPYEKAPSVRLASRRTVGATIGRPFCPVRFGRFPKDGNIYFRRAAIGRPYEKAQTAGRSPLAKQHAFLGGESR